MATSFEVGEQSIGRQTSQRRKRMEHTRLQRIKGEYLIGADELLFMLQIVLL